MGNGQDRPVQPDNGDEQDRDTTEEQYLIVN